LLALLLLLAALMLLLAAPLLLLAASLLLLASKLWAGMLAIAGVLLVPYTTHALFMQSKLFSLYFEENIKLWELTLFYEKEG
jgi:hypothetical protein